MAFWHVYMGIYGGGATSLPPATDELGIGYTVNQRTQYTFRDGKTQFTCPDSKAQFTARNEDDA